MPTTWLKQIDGYSKIVFSNPLEPKCVHSIELVWNKDLGHRGTVNIRCDIKDITQDYNSAALGQKLNAHGFPQHGLLTLSSGDIDTDNSKELVLFLYIIAEAEGIAHKEIQQILDELGIWKEDIGQIEDIEDIIEGIKDIEELYPTKLQATQHKAAAKTSIFKSASRTAVSFQLITHSVFKSYPPNHHPKTSEVSYLKIQSM